MKNQKTFRPTFGVFMHDLDESIGHKRFQGMEDQSRELAVNLLCFLQGTRTEPESNNIFNKLVIPKIDGLITGLSARTSVMKIETLESYFKQFNLPMVTLTEQWEDTSSVLFDHYQGMRQAILHLVKEHHYRRILFIRGPVDHCAAMVRHRAYIDVMKEYNLYDPGLVTPPVDWKPNRKETFEQLIGGMQPGIDFEAVAASNDDWAMEAIYRLQNRGVNIPAQVAVIGFNDTIQAKSFNPPLTTVANSFYEQGREAIRTLYRMVQEPGYQEQVLLPVDLVIRQSCGCLDPLISKTLQVLTVEETTGVGQLLTTENMIAIINQVLVDADLEKACRWTKTLLETFFGELDDGHNPQTFLQTLNSAMLSSLGGNEILSRWQNVVTTIQRAIVPTLDRVKQEKAEMLLHQARILIGSNAL
ncbi:MAG TPA: LacI family DNA-binding transcriptional regulator, partial [Bacillota bacterium]|nr:LacI family DNA-binding transcriptional regulator [Bacillota bacterium]